MQHLEVYLDELEEAYDDFFSKTVKAANYAEASDGYMGEMFDTVDFNIPGAEKMLDEKVEEARELKDEVDDYLFQLSEELQAFLDGRHETPERVDEIDSRMGEIRDMYFELENELKIISGEKVPEDDVDSYSGHERQVEALQEEIEHIDAEGL